MRRVSALWLVVCFGAMSCGAKASAWPGEFAKAACAYSRECTKRDFNDAYTSMSACVDDVSQSTSAVLVGLDTCYDAKNAKACLKAYHRAQASCDSRDSDQLSTACADVFPCAGDGRGGGDGGGDSAGGCDSCPPGVVRDACNAALPSCNGDQTCIDSVTQACRLAGGNDYDTH